MSVQRLITIGVILGLLLLVFGLLTPAIYQAREDARRRLSQNHLKQIGLALHNYHETWRCLPPGGVIREDDTALNGWMASIMNFMEASPYYSMIDFNQPWDSLGNIVVFELSRPSCMNPSVSEHFTSTGYGLTHFQGNPNLFCRNSCVKMKQMKNGTTHTWMAGEVAGNFRPWAYPFNWRPLGTKLCSGPESFGYPAWNGGHLLMADGRVVFYSDEISAEILKSFSDAPPVATKEETVQPAKRFQTGDYHWRRIDLQPEPKEKTESKEQREYYANVLRNEADAPLVIRVFKETKGNLTEEEARNIKLKFPVSSCILQIESTTDIAKALEATTLFKAATSEQFQANVKLLQSLQKQLQE